MRSITPLVLASVASLALSSCGGGSAETAVAPAPVATVAPAPPPTPAPSPTATTAGLPTTVVGADTSEGFPQDPKIDDGLKVADWIVPSWGTGKIADTGFPDTVGAFRLICAPSHLSYDDPLAHPGKKGASHLHQFFGNTLADANSTYKSLRTTGESTCGDMLNRSAYWMPALLNGRGQVVQPDYATVYYKRRPASDPECRLGKGCIGLPRGLRYVFGRTHEGTTYARERTDGVAFTCDSPDFKSAKSSFSEVAATCFAPYKIGVQISAPECWNGKELDTADHRSHVLHTIHVDGREMCPTTHPYRIPSFAFIVWYSVDDTLDRSGKTGYNPAQWYFASDRADPNNPLPSGATVHADWFGAWNDDALARWIKGCIDGFLSCAGGDLGDGGQLKGASQPSYGWTNPNRLVPIPPRPTA